MEVRDKGKELGSSLNTCQGYDIQMLLIHRLSYGPALTRNTEEKTLGLTTTSLCNPPYDRFQSVFNSSLFRIVVPHIPPAPLSSIASRIFLQSGTVSFYFGFSKNDVLTSSGKKHCPSHLTVFFPRSRKGFYNRVIIKNKKIKIKTQNNHP